METRNIGHDWEYAIVYQPGPTVSMARFAARSAAGRLVTWDTWEVAGAPGPLSEHTILSELYGALLELMERRTHLS